MKVSIIIPMYNEESCFQALIQRIETLATHLQAKLEVVFVDDHSSDNTPLLLSQLYEGSNVMYKSLRLSRNTGSHIAIIAGIQNCTGDCAVFMAADLQDPPEAILLLVSKIEEGFAGVFACRKGSYESAIRLLQSKIFKQLLHFLCKVPANAGMFVAVNRKMIERVLPFCPDLPFLVPLMGFSGLSTASIVVERPKRIKGVSGYSSYKRFKLAFEILLSVLRKKFFH